MPPHRHTRTFGFIGSLLEPITNKVNSAISSAQAGTANAEKKVIEARKALEEMKKNADKIGLKREHWKALENIEKNFQATLDKIDAIKFSPERIAKIQKMSKITDYLFILAVFGLLGSVAVLSLIMKRKRRKAKEAEEAKKPKKKPVEEEYEYVEVEEGETPSDDDEYEYIEVAEGEELPESDE